MQRSIGNLFSRSVLRGALSPLRMLALAMLLAIPPAHAIFDGALLGDAESQSVPAIGHWTQPAPCPEDGCQGNPGSLVRVATANVISHRGIDQRCVLTARHAPPWDENDNPQYPRVVMRSDVEELRPEDPDQLVAWTRTRGLLPEDAPHTFRDLRINWLENRLDDPANGDVRIHLGDYVARPIEAAPMALLNRLPRPRYGIWGYGHNDDIALADDTFQPLGLGHLRSGQARVVSAGWEAGGAGARMLTAALPDPVNSECRGDSGAAVRIDGHGVISGVVGGSLAACNPGDRERWGDPDTRRRFGPDRVLHTLLNSNGAEIASPPEDTAWEDVGNWEQIVYFINDICTKDMKFGVSGDGYIDGYVDNHSNSPLETYGTDRLNKEISCVGRHDRLVWSLGDCAEAVHQPEDLVLTAVANNGWEFFRWSDGPYETDPDTGQRANCPCIGQGAECDVTFDEIGAYSATGSYDLSYCVAEFREVAAPPRGGGGLPLF